MGDEREIVNRIVMPADNTNYVITGIEGDVGVEIDLSTPRVRWALSFRKGDHLVMVTGDKLWELLNARIKSFPIYETGMRQDGLDQN